MNKVVNHKTSNPWSQRMLFTGNLSQRLSDASPRSKGSHIASVSSEFFETLAVAVLGGRRGAVNSEVDICPDLHIKRGSEPTLVEVKGGNRRYYFKCDTRQLQNYKACGERVEYAFIAFGMHGQETLSQHADTIGELYEYYSRNINYMVVMDVAVVYSAWKAGVLVQRKYKSWAKDSGVFDIIYMNQKFLRQIIENGIWDTDLKGLPDLKWRKRHRKSTTFEISGVKHKVVGFPVIELVRPNSEIPF